MRVRVLVMSVVLLAGLLPAGMAAQAAPVASACPADVPDAGFRDVSGTNVHEAAIDCVVWWEMARGATARQFNPWAPVTRGQMATFVARLILRSGGQLDATPGNPFSDDEHSIHHFSINRIAKAGIVAGADGRYRPDDRVTRGQMATFLVKAYQYRTGQRLPRAEDAFSDDDGSVHESNINRAAAAGFTSGVTRRNYEPAAPVLRGQMATFVTRTLRSIVESGQVRYSPKTLRSASALETFGECDELLGYLKERGLEDVGPYGWEGYFSIIDNRGEGDTGGEAPPSGGGEAGGGGSAPEPGPQSGTDFSGTNNQEAGVDESDVVKTDGRLVVSVVGERLRVVDVSGAQPRLTDTLRLPEGYDSQLLLRGTKALVMATSYGEGGGGIDDARSVSPGDPGSDYGPTAVLTLVDLADPDALRIESVLRVDGAMLTARMVDGVARLVLRTGRPAMDFTYPEEGTEESQRQAAQDNRLVVARSTIGDWLPRYRLEDHTGETVEATDGRLMGCGDLSRPPEFSGLGSLNVMTIDLAGQLEPGHVTGVLAGGEVVYASGRNLYVGTTRWGAWTAQPVAAAEVTTEIHKFSITDPTRAVYEASGKIPGHLLNQFSMSEKDGDLRVASTSQPPWWREPPDQQTSQSQVSVLSQSGENLNTIGQVGGLGRGEQIYAVRFIGDVGYVVTFRQTDPLYTIDLSDPTAPRVAGELKILGYSAYLHPVGEGLLLGVGQDADEEGRQRGTQLSLFDVADPANPRRVTQTTLGEGTYSDVEFDHRAFLYWPATGTTVVPVSRYSYDEQTQTEDYWTGAYGFDVERSAITEVGRISHGRPPTDGGEYEAWPGIRRSLVVNGVVYTLSERGLKGSELDTLDDRSWVAFP